MGISKYSDMLPPLIERIKKSSIQRGGMIRERNRENPWVRGDGSAHAYS